MEESREVDKNHFTCLINYLKHLYEDAQKLNPLVEEKPYGIMFAKLCMYVLNTHKY